MSATGRSAWFHRLSAGLALAFLLAGCQEQAANVSEDKAPQAAAAGGELTISQIQGSGPRSPLIGQQVVARGVVSANFIGGLGGFYLASLSEDVDDDPATSEGIFIDWPADAGPRPKPRDVLRVDGRVMEIGDDRASLTALSEVAWDRLGQADIPITDLANPPANAEAWEALEGMRLRIDGPLTLSGHYGLTEFGELLLSFGGPLRQPTDAFPPGPEAQALAEDNARRRLLIDDGSNRRQPDRIWYLPEPPSAAAPLRAGSRLSGLDGVLDQRHGQYRMQLVQAIDRVEQAPRPAPPEPAGSLRIASLNLLNLFNGDGRGGGFPTPRGAATEALYQRQQAKLVAQIVALAPDIAALMEVENDGFGPDSALAQLVAALAAADPGADWRWVDAGEGPGSDAIRVALIFRADRVTPIGKPASLSTGPFASGSRPPLAQAFRAGDGPVFVVVANHFKSKGSCDLAEGADRNAGDGQGCFNAHRRLAAARLSDWLSTDPTRSGSDHALIIGDLNAYSQEDPIRGLLANGWQRLGEEPGFGHSYLFDGALGSLDHALATPAMAEAMRGAAIWAANADENGFFRFENDPHGAPWAASDHNPLVLGFDLAGPRRVE